MNLPRDRSRIGWMLGVLMFAAVTRAADAPPAVVPDAGPAGQPKVVAPPLASAPLFSEDFESGRLDPNIWTQDVTGGNLITVQREQVAHGSYALRVSCPAPSNKTWAFIMAKNLPTALRQHHFGRAYMLVTPKPPDRHTILLMAGTPGFPFNKFLEVATNAGQWQLTYVDLHPTGNKEDYHSGGLVPLNRWFCLEWEFNDHPDHTTVWVDGKLVYETNFVAKDTGAVTDLVDGFSDLAFGFRLWGAAPAPFDVYYDDIALDTKRLGQRAPIPEK
jgi:hypothetical protein